ncbi:MAG: glycosyltransferase family 9 protein [Gemmatimonadota bacterium]|nr:glycosyltransferase family 9 protein [Gemmatimonadota bacterium]
MRIPRRDLFQSREKHLLAVASELASPLLAAAARSSTGRPPTPAADWRKGLIISHTHIGDLLYRTCSLETLRSGLPNCSWDYLVSPAGAEVLTGNPAISEILPLQLTEDSWSLSATAMRDLALRGYDVVLCTNTVRHYADFVTALRLRVPNRVGISTKGFSAALTLPVEAEMPMAYPAYFRSIVSAVTGVPASWSLRPRIYLDGEATAEAGEAWQRGRLAAGKPVIACTLTTRQPHGAWPADLFVRSLERASSATGAQIVFCGSAADAEQLHAAAATCSAPSTVLAGELGVRAFAAFLSRCSALLATDSGPRHVANAVGTPVVFGRNLTYSRIEAGTYTDTETDIAPPADEFVRPAELPNSYAKVSVEAIASALVSRLSISAAR